MKEEEVSRFSSHGFEYRINEDGLITQINPQPFKYDAQYSSTYDTPEYQRASDVLQALRLGYILGVCIEKPLSLLDFGYGNGAFMKAARQCIDEVYGYDVTGVTVPEGCRVSHTPFAPVDVMTFHDALEHIQDLSFLKDLRARVVVISLPFCHYFEAGQQWFDTAYKHRKPNEHIHHFTPSSLSRTMERYGFLPLGDYSSHEDIVRKSTHGWQPNILTMAFTNTRRNY